jgi:hypothetical protein
VARAPPETGGRVSARARAVARRLRPFIPAAIVLGIVAAVAAQWSAIASFDWRLSWLPFACAVALFAVGPLMGATAFWLVTRDLTRGTSLVPCLEVWGRSFAARFVPSGALTVAVRVSEHEALDASPAQVWSATVYEQLVSATAGAGVAVAGFALAGKSPPAVATVFLCVTAVGMLGAGRARRFLVERARPPRFVEVWQPVRNRSLLCAVLVDVGGWMVAGAATWLFAGALISRPVPGVAFLVGAYAFAWLVGFVVPFVPSGLGIREATLVALLTPYLGAAGATALAVALRLANIAGDLVAIGAIEVLRRSTRRLRERAPSRLSPQST